MEFWGKTRHDKKMVQNQQPKINQNKSNICEQKKNNFYEPKLSKLEKLKSSLW